MKKRSIGMIVIIFLCSATLVFAGDQTRAGKQKPKRAGSCQTDLTGKTVQNLLVADQTQIQSRQQKRLKNGVPGNSDLIDAVDGKLLAAEQSRVRDPKQDRRDRDRSCQADLTGNTDQNLQAAGQTTRTRTKQALKRDGSCKG